MSEKNTEFMKLENIGNVKKTKKIQSTEETKTTENIMFEELQFSLEKKCDLVEPWDSSDLAKVKVRVFKGHTDDVSSCQFIEDDKVFSASSDCSVKLWDSKTGQCIKSFNKIHNSHIPQAHCLPDGSKFASCGWDKYLKYFDVETGKCLLEKVHPDYLTCVQISHDGKLVALGSDLCKSLRIWDLNSGKIAYDLSDVHKYSLTSVRFCPNDDKVVTGSRDYSAKFFDLKTLTSTITLEGHKNGVTCCAISNDERKCATASWDKTIRIWDVSTGMYRTHGPVVLEDSHEGSVSSCNFSNDGLFLVSGSFDTSVVVWDLENNNQKLKLLGHMSYVNDVCFSEDQKWLLSASKDCTIRLWNLEKSDQIPMVIESKKAVKVVKCKKCSKPFSLSQLEAFQDVTLCVFCRLSNPEKSWLIFNDVE